MRLRVWLPLLLGVMVAGAQGAGADVGGPQVGGSRSAAADPLPGDSLYQLPVTLESSTGKSVQLSSFRGQPLLITMFYGSCTSVCPLVTGVLLKTDQALAPEDRTRLRVLMVSLDARRDTPEFLAGFANRHGIDDPRWTIARTSAHDVRTLAAALGIRYRELPDQTFNHSTVITLLDADGVTRARTTQIGGVDEEFLGQVRSTLRKDGRR